VRLRACIVLYYASGALARLYCKYHVIITLPKFPPCLPCQSFPRNSAKVSNDRLRFQRGCPRGQKSSNTKLCQFSIYSSASTKLCPIFFNSVLVVTRSPLHGKMLRVAQNQSRQIDARLIFPYLQAQSSANFSPMPFRSLNDRLSFQMYPLAG